jgi:hypothetical protein
MQLSHQAKKHSDMPSAYALERTLYANPDCS